jgi:L-ascorbate metabolism protein UlaG (beta-lactamase superfamily)
MGLTFTWLGHSCFLFDLGGRKAIIDPFLRNNPLAPVSPEEIEAEIILITHGHGDHVADAPEIARRTGALVVATPEICAWFGRQGVSNTWEGNIGGTYYGEFLNAKWLPALHTSSLPDGSYGGAAMGFLIEIGGRRLYHAGDTGLFGDMRLIGETRLDVAFLPIGDKYTMGIDDSLLAIKMLNPRYVVPMHFNTFPPLSQDVTDWARRVNNETNATPIVNDPGYAYHLA